MDNSTSNFKEKLLTEPSLLSKMLDSIPAIIYVYDLKENKTIFSNQMITSYLGYTTDEIQTMGSDLFKKTIHPDDLKKVIEFQENLAKTDNDKIYEIEYRMKNAKGNWIWLQSKERIFARNKSGKAIQKIGIALDITINKNLEKKAEKKSSTLDAINTILSGAILGETEEEISKNCLEITQEITNSAFGFIGEVNPNGKFDTIAQSDPGWSVCRIEKSQAVKMIKNMELKGLWAKTIHENKPFIANDPKNHPDSLGVPEGHPPLKSFLGVPLRSEGSAIGMIALANKEDGYDESDVETVEKLSTAIVESLNKKRTDVKIMTQSEEILEISTPAIKIWDGIITMPLIGSLDSERTEKFMEKLLKSIIDTNAEIALIDITGVPSIDTQTAHHLIDSISAAKLLGAQVILTGVSPVIAQTLVHLGIDLAEFETMSSLASGLKKAFKKLGIE